SPPRENYHIPLFPMETKDENIDGENEFKEEEERGENFEFMDLNQKVSCVAFDFEKKRRPSRNVKRPLKYNEYMDYSDEESETFRKKWKTEKRGRKIGEEDMSALVDDMIEEDEENEDTIGIDFD
ncbi:hypothetical protein PENTCL1PPCAC_12971, partial [Pristionchus entomophagus]